MATAERSIVVAHNAEIAHRLFLTPGKCQRIHGHSLKVRLCLVGAVDSNGLLAGIDFAELKAGFRGFLDHYLDHSILLNENDDLASFINLGDNEEGPMLDALPGLRKCAGDPTTENIAMWIGDWAAVQFAIPKVFAVHVYVEETAVNHADYRRGMASLDPMELTDVLGRMRRA